MKKSITCLLYTSGKGAHIVNPEGSSSADAVSYIDLGDQIQLGAEDFTISFWYQSSTGNESGGAVISAKDYKSGSNDGFAIGSFTDELRGNLAFDGTREVYKRQPSNWSR